VCVEISAPGHYLGFYFGHHLSDGRIYGIRLCKGAMDGDEGRWQKKFSHEHDLYLLKIQDVGDLWDAFCAPIAYI
jgi:hypothetical protein